jgi:hypothetical protein
MKVQHDISSTRHYLEMNGQPGTLAALMPGKPACSPRLGIWLGFKIGIDTVLKSKTFFPCVEWNQCRPARSLSLY